MKFGETIMEEERGDFSFCLKKAGGLNLISSNDRLTEVYKRKSRSALNMLESAKQKQEEDWILDTSYYAKYFIIYALFMKCGIKSEIHDCTIFGLKSLFVEENIITEEIYKELKNSKELRVGALYFDKDFGMNEILKRANIAPDFCLNVESIIERLTPEEINKVRNKLKLLKETSIK